MRDITATNATSSCLRMEPSAGVQRCSSTSQGTLAQAIGRGIRQGLCWTGVVRRRAGIRSPTRNALHSTLSSSMGARTTGRAEPRLHTHHAPTHRACVQTHASLIATTRGPALTPLPTLTRTCMHSCILSKCMYLTRFAAGYGWGGRSRDCGGAGTQAV